MSSYRVIVHYHVKPGMEGKLKSFLENNILKPAQDLGCLDPEYMHDENDPSHFIGTGIWDSMEKCQNFHMKWEGLKEELLQYCAEEPYREIYCIDNRYPNKSKRAA